MAIHFISNIVDDILEITTWGFDENIEEVKNYGFSILEEAMRAEKSKILVDERELEYQMGMTETFELAKLAGSVTPTNVKVAIVSQPKFKDSIEFYEQIASLRGFKIKSFFEKENAISWLKSD